MADANVVVFSSLNLAEVHLIRSALAREGIPSKLKSQFLGPLAGEVPMDAARAELCVTASLVSRALNVIQTALSLEGPDHVCPECKELNPVSFEVCWNCDQDIEH